MQLKELISKNFAPQSVRLKPVIVECWGDLETPVSAYLKLTQHGARFLLESVEQDNKLGRYSFIGLNPQFRMSVDRQTLIITQEKMDAEGTAISHAIPHSGNPLNMLRKILNCFQIDHADRLPTLLGGLVGFVGFDFVRFLEKIRDLDEQPRLPLALFYFSDKTLVFDHLEKKIQIIYLDEHSLDSDSQQNSQLEINKVIEILQSPLVFHSPLPLPRNEGWQSNLTREQFCQLVESAKEHILSGEVYQLVLSQKSSCPSAGDPFLVYRALRTLNPSPYMFYLDFDFVRLIGSSPEVMVKLERNKATLRPIAGTRPRGQDHQEDQNLAAELLADEKENAEHIMLVDLARNDLGRCCQFGTVSVAELRSVEKFSHVMHLTSQVEGKLLPDKDQFDLFCACFPAGTVTGAPKIKALELINEYEKCSRGPYAGAVGYFSLSGDMDFCITIRTIVEHEKRFHLRAGAGIVHDSVPEREYQETLSKMAALKQAIEIAAGGLK